MDYTHICLHKALNLFRSGHLTPSEMLEHCLKRLDALNDEINAMETLCTDDIWTAAKKMDALWENGGRTTVVTGIPMSLKSAWDPRNDVIQSLLKGGALMIGTTRVPKNVTGQETASPEFGRTLNPMDTHRTAGGSSGGSAASIAAGFALFDWGSDSGGSILLPAAFTGVAGMRCTHGLFPVRGHHDIGWNEDVRCQKDFLSVGPLTACPIDVEMILKYLCHDMCLGYRMYPCLKRDLKEFRVAHLIDPHVLPMDTEVHECLTDQIDFVRPALGEFKKAEFKVGDRTLESVIEDMYQLWRIKVMNQKVDEEKLRRLEHVRNGLRMWFHNLFILYDILLMPISLIMAPPISDTLEVHDLKVRDQLKIEINGKEYPYLTMIKWCTFINACGLPVMSVPVGFGMHTDMPVSLGVVGNVNADIAVARFASLLYMTVIQNT